MRRLAGGVSIISGAGPAGPLGVTATAVTSLTADPPSVLCCLNRALDLESAVKEAGTFGVNMLRADHQLSGRAVRRGCTAVSGTAKFERGDWSILPSSVPTLADMLGELRLQCRNRSSRFGTHSIFVRSDQRPSISATTEIRWSTATAPSPACFPSTSPHRVDTFAVRCAPTI